MSHTLSLACGCQVYVSTHPTTSMVHTRIIERREPSCLNRRHVLGTRLYLWELLPEPSLAREQAATAAHAIEWT